MSVDGGDGVLFHQVSDELEEGEALGFGAGVGRATVGIKAADIGDAYAVCVVAFGMCARLLDRAARMDAAVGVNDIMIADVVPAKALMVAADVLHSADGIGPRCGAMDKEKRKRSHLVW